MLIDVLNKRARLKSKFTIWKINSGNSPRFRMKRQKVRWKYNINKRSKRTDITETVEEKK